jgi:hypothetical protein
MSLTLESPFAARFSAWMEERFPVKNAVLFSTLYLGALLFGRALTHPGQLGLGFKDLAGFMAVWSFFFMLRVFDEHKDYELDLKNHPQRVLQSGLITLGHLKIAGVLAVLVQLGASLLIDGGFGRVTLFWLVTMAWSCLMAKEFFVGEWLGKRLVLYAVSHMLAMPLAIGWMMQMGAGTEKLPLVAGALAAMAFFSGLAFEIARKTKAPEDERPTVDSYTKIMGTRGAAFGTLTVLVIAAGIEAYLLSVVPGGRALYIGAGVVAVVLVAVTLPLLGFAKQPTPGAAKKVEAFAGVAMLVQYVVLIVALLASRGVQWL